jgi:hypothetical protein
VANWKDAQALATELGSTTQFPDLPLQITAPGEESGTYDAFLELAGITATGTTRGKFDADHPAALRLPGPELQPPRPMTTSSSPAWKRLRLARLRGLCLLRGRRFRSQGAGRRRRQGLRRADEGDHRRRLPTHSAAACTSIPTTRRRSRTRHSRRGSTSILSDAGIANVSTVGYVQLPADQLQASRDAWANH